MFTFQTSKADKRKSGSSSDRDSLQETTSSRISAAVSAFSPSRLRVEHPKSGASTFKSAKDNKGLPYEFGEHPRAAPTPPARKGTAPPESWWGGKSSPSPTSHGSVASSKSTTVPLVSSPVVIEPLKESPPPPIPAKSPKRQKSKAPRDAHDIFKLLEQDPFGGGGIPRQSSHSKRSKKRDAAKNKDEPVKEVQSVKENRMKTSRSFTEPVEAPKPIPTQMPTMGLRARARSAAADDRAQTEPFSNPSVMRTKLAGVRGGRVDKSIKRLSTGSTIRAEGLDLEDLSTFLRSSTPPNRFEEQDAPSSSQDQLQGRRDRHGGTLSMLLRDGFFQISSAGEKVNHGVATPLVLVEKALPPTPPSSETSPTERDLIRAVQPFRRTNENAGKPAAKRRSPLSQVSATNSRRNTSKSSFPSPSTLRLPAIPESQPASSENTPPQSGRTTPTATKIHLRGGSVVTVCPPELTAWQRSVYIQGPIKLPKPVIIPRKNSLATLEPFQEVIDQVYQDALSIPRRRSDEQAFDDICGFFDEYGFEDVGFEGDRFDMFVMMGDGEVDEGQDVLIAKAEGDIIERFSTPPMEPDATPVETVMAKGIMGTTSKPLPVQTMPATATPSESGRAGNVAKLTAQRKDSHTLTMGSNGSELQLLPVPEDSILETELESSRPEASAPSILTAKPGDRNSSGSESIEELDGNSSWIAPHFPRKTGVTAGVVQGYVGSS